MAIEAMTGAGSVDETYALASSRPSDVVLSPDGLRIYTSGADGKVRTYNSETGELLSAWTVGRNLGAIDVSPDGEFLMVVEKQRIWRTGDNTSNLRTKVTVYQVDLATGEATSFPYVASGLDSTFFDVAILSSGRVLLSQVFDGSGMVEMKLLNPTTGNYSELNRIDDEAILTRTADGSQVLIGMRSSAGALRIYEAGVGMVAGHGNYEDGVAGYNQGVQAINGPTGLVAQHLDGYGFHIYGPALDHQLDLADLYPDLRSGVAGVAFDEDGDFLFILDTDADAIIQLSTADWSLVQTIALDADVTGGIGDYANRLLVAPGMRFFTLVTDTDLQRIDNPAVDDVLEGTRGSDTIVGSYWSETLLGLDGNDRLDGRGGSDLMEGGRGHDTYVVDRASDRVVEGGSSGTDTVETSVSYTLPVHFEKLVLTGTFGIDGRGNAAANRITGNEGGNFLNGGRGDDVIDGGAGNDQIVGGPGGDTLKGGAGDDRFYFNAALGSANVDAILDFSAADDVIRLDRSVFTRAGPEGTLGAAAFHQGAAAADAGDRILYDAASGDIFYDADGTGAAAAILFATVTAGTPLTHADFTIYI